MIYQELRTSIELWSNNTDPDFLQQIDRFIVLAEKKIGGKKKLPAYLVDSPISTIANNNLLSLTALLPAFISVEDLTLPGYGMIEQKDNAFIAEAYPDPTETGPPRYFGMFNNNTLVFGPTPDAVYTPNLHYVAQWPSLVQLGHSSNPTTRASQTFISQFYEPALLAYSMYYAGMFMQKDAAAMQVLKMEADDSLGLVTLFGDGPAKKQNAETTNAANDAGNW